MIEAHEIPWSDIAFASTEFTLRRYLEDRAAGTQGHHFVEFGPPIAAASIAQVHKAIAKAPDGSLRPVAVKILRPGIERRFREVRRRTRPMGVFQDRTSMDRILFAVFTRENRQQGTSSLFALTQTF